MMNAPNCPACGAPITRPSLVRIGHVAVEGSGWKGRDHPIAVGFTCQSEACRTLLPLTAFPVVKA